MRRIDLMLIIVAIIFLTAGCAEKSTYQNSYYGEWVASDKLYYMPISAMSEDYYKENFYGKTAFYSERQASFAGEVIENPKYVERVVNEDNFFDESRIELSSLGIKENEVKVIEIDDWTSPGAILIIKDKNTLITLWDGVFFELKRK